MPCFRRKKLSLFLPQIGEVKVPLCMVDLAQTISEWKDVEGNKEDDQYLGDICFSLRYVPTSGKVNQTLRTEMDEIFPPSSEENFEYFEYFKGKKRIFPKLHRMMPEALEK